MSDFVLRHGIAPFVNANESRLRFNLQNFIQFATNQINDLVLGKLDGVRIASATEKDAKQSHVVGRSILEFVVHEGAGHHALAFAARNQKSKTRRQTKSGSRVAKSNGHGGSR